MSPETLFTSLRILSLLFGLMVGSFLNVLRVRLPEKRSIVTPRSSCPLCGAGIALYDNIPILSYLLLSGKCRGCGGIISPWYPIVESITGGVSIFLFSRTVRTYPLSAGEILLYLVYFYFACSMILAAFIDLKHQIIPNVITLPGIGLGIIFSSLFSLSDLYGSTSPFIQNPGPLMALAGAVIGGGFLLLISLLYSMVTGREGMGFGDVKLMAMIGAFLGPHPAILFILVLSSFAGSFTGITIAVIFRKGLRHPIPYGPFLAGGALIYLLWGSSLIARLLPPPETGLF